MKQVTIENVKARIAQLETSEHIGGRLSIQQEFEMACLRQLLATMEAQKPFGYLEPLDFPRTTATLYPERDRYATIPLYAAPQPVAVPEDIPRGLAGQIVSLLAHNIGDKFLAQKIWNACRASMLNQSQQDPAQDNTAQQFESLAGNVVHVRYSDIKAMRNEDDE